MTYGELRLRLTKLAPGIDLELIDGWLQDRYTEILDRLPWQRIRATAILMTTAPYKTGAAAVSQGSQDVYVNGGAWDGSMTGRVFRVTNDDPFYEFTWIDAAHGALDRPYEGVSNAAAEYAIYQSIYPLPPDCRIIESMTGPLGEVDQLSPPQLSVTAPSRNTFGTPQIRVPYMDDASSPPRMQVELYPIPDAAVGLELTYIAEVSAPGSTGLSLLPWVRPAALIEGVMADVKRHLGDFSSTDRHEMRFKELVSEMMLNEAMRNGATRMQVADRFMAHRVKRWSR